MASPLIGETSSLHDMLPSSPVAEKVSQPSSQPGNLHRQLVSLEMTTAAQLALYK